MSHEAKFRLNVITPCSRPVYQPIIACQLNSFKKVRVRWFVVYDHCQKVDKVNHLIPPALELFSWTKNVKTPSCMGSGQRNEALDQIVNADNEWVAFLDDDTVFPNGYEDMITQSILADPNAEGFVFQQSDKTGDLRMDVNPVDKTSFIVKVDNIPYGTLGCDTGQMLFKRTLIGNERWRPQTAADHPFYRDVACKMGNQNKVRWLKQIGSVHNALR